MKPTLTCITLAVCITANSPAANLDPARPNVLIIYFDDMGYGDRGANQPTGLAIPADSAYLNPAVPTLTPKLDTFAAQSMRFTHGHSADGVCTPSRYALITGRYTWRTSRKSGVTGGYSKPLMSADRFTIGKMFQAQGYKTAMVGKWHVGMQFYSPAGAPVDLGNNATALANNLIDFSKPLTDTPYHRGFDYYFGTPASLDMPPYLWIESNSTTDEVRCLFKGGIVSGGIADFSQVQFATNADLVEGATGEGGRDGAKDPNFILADYLQIQAQKVSDLIAARATDSEPFFIYVPMPAPHTPHAVQPQFQGSAGYTYGDYVVQTDYYTGVILDALGDPAVGTSLASNTVVFITSDNGPETGAYTSSRSVSHDANGPFKGVKRDNWEGGTRVPFMIRWPGKVTPGTSAHACWQGDFLPTMAAYLGHDLEPGEAPDGESILPLLLGNPMPAARRAAFIEHSSSGQFAIVDNIGEWKLLDGTGGGGNSTSYDADNVNISSAKGTIRGTPRQLYNLLTDPGERDNLLVDDPANLDDNNDPTAAALAKETELYNLLNTIRGNTTTGIDGDSDVPPADNDADDISNEFENQHPGLDRNDPSDRNTDLEPDGLDNLQEYQNGSDPNDTDSDDDRLEDAEEVNELGTQPGNAHSDSDTLDDGDEVLVYATNPLLPDSDGDGVDDDDELSAFSNPRNAAATPIQGPPTETALDPSMAQLVGVNGDASNPQVDGDASSGWTEAGTLFVRERTASGSNLQWRTRLFLKFDFSGLSGTLESARLRIHQTDRLNNSNSANLELSRVTDPWGTTAGSYPLFDATGVADTFLFGNNGDFGTPTNAAGFYSGTPGTPATDDSGFDPGGQVSAIVGDWFDGTNPNHGFRAAFADRAFVGAAFSDSDDPATTGADERLQLLVTTRPLSQSLDADGDLLLDSYETTTFGDLTRTGDGDEDGDGINNAAEQAFGSDPKDASSQPATEIELTDQAEFSFHRHLTAGLGYEILAGTDMTTWEPFTRYFEVASPAPPSDLGPEYEKVKITTLDPLPERLFVKVAVRTL